MPYIALQDGLNFMNIGDVARFGNRPDLYYWLIGGQLLNSGVRSFL